MILFSSSYAFFEHIAKDFREMLGRDNDIGKAKSRDNVDNGSDSNEKRWVEESFLYPHFLQKKDTEAERVCLNKKMLFSVKDKYILAKGASLAYEKKIITKAEYRELFFLANKSAKSGQKKRAELFESEPQNAQKQLEDRLLKDAIEGFIDNMLNTKRYDDYFRRQSEKSNKAASAKREKYTDAIEMLSAFYQHENGKENANPELSANTFRSDLSEEFIKSCGELHNLIRGEKEWNYAFVPLYIDRDSGAGVYLIGKDNFKIYGEDLLWKYPENITEIFGEDYVAACVLSFSEIKNADESNVLISMEHKLYGSVSKAFTEFQVGLVSQNYFEGFAYNNNDEFPIGADERFKALFINDKMRYEILNAEAQKEAEGIKQLTMDS